MPRKPSDPPPPSPSGQVGIAASHVRTALAAAAQAKAADPASTVRPMASHVRRVLAAAQAKLGDAAGAAKAPDAAEAERPPAIKGRAAAPSRQAPRSGVPVVQPAAWGGPLPAAVRAAPTLAQQEALKKQTDDKKTADAARVITQEDQAALTRIQNFIDPNNAVPDGSHPRVNYFATFRYPHDRLERVRTLWNALGAGYHSFSPDANHPGQYHFLRPTVGRAGYNDNVHVYES